MFNVKCFFEVIVYPIEMKGPILGLLVVIAIMFAFGVNRQQQINHPVVREVQIANLPAVAIQVPISALEQSGNLFTYQPNSEAPVLLTWTINTPGKLSINQTSVIQVPTSAPRLIPWSLGKTSGVTTILPYIMQTDSRTFAMKASGYRSTISSRPMWRGI